MVVDDGVRGRGTKQAHGPASRWSSLRINTRQKRVQLTARYLWQPGTRLGAANVSKTRNYTRINSLLRAIYLNCQQTPFYARSRQILTSLQVALRLRRLINTTILDMACRLPCAGLRQLPSRLRPSNLTTPSIITRSALPKGFSRTSKQLRQYATTRIVHASECTFGQPVHETHPNLLKPGECMSHVQPSL